MTKTSFPKSKIKILLLEGIHPVAYDFLKSEGFDVTLEKTAWSEKQVLDVIGDIHVLGIRSKTRVARYVATRDSEAY